MKHFLVHVLMMDHDHEIVQEDDHLWINSLEIDIVNYRHSHFDSKIKYKNKIKINFF